MRFNDYIVYGNRKEPEFVLQLLFKSVLPLVPNNGEIDKNPREFADLAITQLSAGKVLLEDVKGVKIFYNALVNGFDEKKLHEVYGPEVMDIIDKNFGISR